MNIYIDFEATQFSFDIISIGAVKENGESFYTLVKPRDIKKITPLITKITGLTQEMFTDDVPTICEIFPIFVNWATKETKSVTFFTYGGFDKTLIGHCVKRYPEYKEFFFVQNNMVNIEKLINKFMNSDSLNSMSLLSVYEYLFGSEHDREHNALTDAYMLFKIHSYMADIPFENIVVVAENEALNKYLKKYRQHKLDNKAIREYLNTLCSFELEFLTIEDLIRVSPNVKISVDLAIHNYYYMLYGKKLKGYVYEK